MYNYIENCFLCSLFVMAVWQSSNTMLQWRLFIHDDFIQVHWFPRHISELDLIANRTLDAGVDLEADHPGFHDINYRQRRAKLAELALNHRMHHEIPHTEYTKEEVETWGLVWDTMEDLWAKVWMFWWWYEVSFIDRYRLQLIRH